MTEGKNWQHRAKASIKKETVKEFLSWSNHDFITEIMALRQQVETLQAEANREFNEPDEKDAITESRFDKTWSVPTKVVFILHLLNKPLLSADIYTKLTRLDKSFKDFSSSKTVLSNYLSRSVKSGRIKRIKSPGIKQLYFALPEWMNENGLLKEPYQSFIPKF